MTLILFHSVKNFKHHTGISLSSVLNSLAFEKINFLHWAAMVRISSPLCIKFNGTKKIRKFCCASAWGLSAFYLIFKDQNWLPAEIQILDWIFWVLETISSNIKLS